MKKLVVGAVLLLAACEEMPAGAGFGAAMGGFMGILEIV